MNWEALFNMQEKLDAYIADNHSLHGQDLFEERFLALLVELGELANETRCFKFWSTKSQSDDAVILEEYVDNIHFLLSIGNHKNYQFSTIEIQATQDTKTKNFNHVFKQATIFYIDQSKENYLTLFRTYLQLASLLGFSEADIQTAYHQKNEVNYERQESGY